MLRKNEVFVVKTYYMLCVIGVMVQWLDNLKSVVAMKKKKKKTYFLFKQL